MSKVSSSATITAHYDADYFEWQNSLGKLGGSLNAEFFSPFIEADSAVLDFGCGGGWLLASVTAKRKLGVDINPYAREAAKNLGIDTVDNIESVVDDSFDVVISNHALEHAEAPLDMVRKIFVKLRRGGLAVFMVPCERYDTQYFLDNIDQHLYTWSPINIGNLFRHAGFDIISVKRVAFRWPPRVDLIDRFLGRALCNSLCRLYAYLRPKLTQIRVVARKP